MKHHHHHHKRGREHNTRTSHLNANPRIDPAMLTIHSHYSSPPCCVQCTGALPSIQSAAEGAFEGVVGSGSIQVRWLACYFTQSLASTRTRSLLPSPGTCSTETFIGPWLCESCDFELNRSRNRQVRTHIYTSTGGSKSVPLSARAVCQR